VRRETRWLRGGVIDIADIRGRWRKALAFLDERDRRLFAANEALAQGHGGVTATSVATGLARSTIDRGIEELRSARNELGTRLRRPGGGRKSAVTHQPALPAALEKLIEDAIRGDPMSPLRWVSRSQRHLVKTLTSQGFKVSQRVVGKLLRELNYSCQANRKTRQGRPLWRLRHCRQPRLGQCRHQCRHRGVRRREHPALVVQARQAPLSKCDPADDHRGLRRQQWAAGQAMEARTPAPRQ
jgi:hypothetical protein